MTVLYNDLVPCFFLLILALFCKAKKQNDIYNCLSLDHSNHIKGLAAISVVFCHLSIFYDGKVILPVLYYLGCASVGLFFFLSGYGLMKQYLSKENYRSSFLKKRFTKILIPYLLFTFLYYFYYLSIGETKSISDVIVGIVQGDPIVSYSWYILEIIVLYLFFYIFMHFGKNKKNIMIISNCVLYVMMLTFYRVNGYANFWFDSTHMFVIGILWASYEKTLIECSFRFRYVLLGLSAIGIAITFGKMNMISFFEIFYFVLFILVFIELQITNGFLKLLGNISMEIYLIHGLIIKACRYFIDLNQDAIEMTVILVGIIVTAYISHHLIKKLDNWILHR